GLRLEPGHQLLARGQRAAALRDLDPVTWLDAAEALHPVRAVPLVGDGGRPFRPYGPAGADVLDHTHLPTPSIGCDGPGLQSRASAQERTSRLAGARPVATYAWIPDRRASRCCSPSRAASRSARSRSSNRPSASAQRYSTSRSAAARSAS